MTDVATGFVIKAFLKDTRPGWFEEAMAIRETVFVAEQNVSPDEERDAYDETAMHWLVWMADTETPVATARMIPYQEGCQMRPVAKIGRVAVLEAYRGKGLGQVLMDVVIAAAIDEGYAQIILDAQTRVLSFYERLGFASEGEEFLDANIPHYRMRKVLE